ncbi:MAG: DUF308 domain-containing protein [Treponema sp.]|nr:DUF308 domain-containing protein [Treponema sp.]
MKKTNWIIGGVLLVAGIILTAAPVFIVKALVVLLGLGAVADGVYSLMYEKSISTNSTFQKTILYKSAANIVMGLIAVIVPLFIAKTAWFAITYILGVYLVISAFGGLFASSQLKDSDVDRKALTVESLFHIAAAVLLFLIGPEKLGKSLIRIIGILTLSAGIVLLTVQVLRMKNTTVAKDVEVRNEE